MTEKQTTATLAKVAKLMAAQAELVERLQAIGREVDQLLNGGVGIGSQMQRFSTTFAALWGERYKSEYVWQHAKDRPNMKRLLQKLTVDELEARALVYLRSDDPFWVRSRHNFGLFVASINSLAPEATATPDLELTAPVSDCRHVPPCRSDQEHTRRKLADMRGSHSGPVGDVL